MLCNGLTELVFQLTLALIDARSNGLTAWNLAVRLKRRHKLDETPQADDGVRQRVVDDEVDDQPRDQLLSVLGLMQSQTLRLSAELLMMAHWRRPDASGSDAS